MHEQSVVFVKMLVWRVTLETNTGGIALFVCKSPEIRQYSCFMHGMHDTTSTLGEIKKLKTIGLEGLVLNKTPESLFKS